MPDPLRKVVSASQMPAVFGVSPYASRFSLYHWFRSSVSEIALENRRMTFGKFIEPFILDQATEKLRLLVEHNATQEFVRHSSLPLGCTIDGRVTCPTRGPGIVQAKAVDRRIFKDEWTERKAPAHIEIQLATEMLATEARWGCIAVMIGNNDGIKLYERQRIAKLDDEIAKAARAFMADVAAGREPEASATPADLDVLNQLYGEKIDNRTIEIMDNAALAEDARMLAWTKEQLRHLSATDVKLGNRIKRAMGTAAKLRMPGSSTRRIISRRPQAVVRLPVRLHLRLAELAASLPEGPHREAILEALRWEHIVQQESASAHLKIRLFEGEEVEGDEMVMTP